MRITRRTFVKGGLAVPVLPVLMGSGCGNDVSAAPIVDVEVIDVATDPNYGKIAVTVPMYPQLAAAGGAVTLRIAALPPGTRPFTVPPKGILLIHRNAVDGTAEFVATRADCPHQGCPLGYSANDDRIECPCHGSKFLAVGDKSEPTACAGLVVHPPSKNNLAVYGATLVGETVYVDLADNESCGAVSFPPVTAGVITIPLATYPALNAVGGTLTGTPAGLGDTIIVARTEDQTFITLSDICTHAQCPVNLDTANMRMHCNCHGSNYEYDGTVINGPATKALKSYATTFDGTNVVITVA